jgi:predicted DNA-binding transcriptional regulator AlpA
MVQDLVTKELNMASVRDAMALLDVSRPTIMKWLSDDRFPNAIKEDGRTGEWNIPRTDIEEIRAELIADLKAQIQHLEVLAQSPRQ